MLGVCFHNFSGTVTLLTFALQAAVCAGVGGRGAVTGLPETTVWAENAWMPLITPPPPPTYTAVSQHFVPPFGNASHEKPGGWGWR